MPGVRALTLVALAACAGDGASPPRPADAKPRTVLVDSAAYASLARLPLDSLSVLCPRAAERCPEDEYLFGGADLSGGVAVATRAGSVYYFADSSTPMKQLLFSRNQGSRRGLGGTLEWGADSLWSLHAEGAPSVVRFDGEGRLVDGAVARLTADFGGSAAAHGLFVQLLLPGASQVGDSVDGRFEVVAPRAHRGKVLATMRFAATRSTASDLRPLPPFFSVSPIWGVDRAARLFVSPAVRYELTVQESTGAAARLTAEVPRRAVEAEELDLAAAKFLSTMPASGRFRDAVELDVERRRRSSAPNHPVITDIKVATDGRFLVRGDPGAEDDSVRFDLLASDLAPIGQFRLAALDRVLILSADSLLVARRGERGAPVLQWNRLRGAARSP